MWTRTATESAITMNPGLAAVMDREDAAAGAAMAEETAVAEDMAEDIKGLTMR